MLFTEETGATLDSVTFLVFGAVLLGPAFKHMSWHIVLYAVLSLTVVRMVPVAIALFGTHARPATVVFMGWFGPRGLASIVFAVIVEDAHLPHSAEIATVTYLTVGLSVLVHGLSASPLVNRYVSWFQTTSGKSPPVTETKPAHEYRPRLLGRL
jgi:sodium/hydrogen antiporter